MLGNTVYKANQVYNEHRRITMKGRLLILGLVFVLGALVLNACAPTASGGSGAPTLIPTAAPVDVPPTEQPAVIEEPEWMTYSNERYGYSFQYPSDCFYGRMPVTCKENPPEDRPPECLCFLDGENPDQVIMQAFIGEKENLALAQFRVSHYGSPQFNPPPGTDLIEWLGEILVGMDLDIPDEPNLSIDGIPAAKIYSPGSPQAPSFDEIYLIRDDKLLQIQMLDVDNQENSDLYDQLFSTFETIEIAEQPTEIPAPTPTTKADEEEVTRASGITSLDETWNLYSDYRLGFTIKFPKEVATFRGSCYWNEEQGSYRPKMALVPVKIFEGTDAVYIAREHYFELAGERVEENKSYYDECNQVTNSLDLLRDPERFQEPFWKLVAQEIHDEGELDSFIKARYGSGCSLGEQVASAQEGVYDVGILGDGKDLEETECPLNGGTVVKYFPGGGKVIAWNTGQAGTFQADVNYPVFHDLEMIESFNFLADTAAEASAAPADPYSGWASYVNTDYGFSLRYPATWTTGEVNDEEFVEPGSRSVQLSQGSVVLVIGYRHLGESFRIGGGGGGGDFEARGTVRILDHDVPRQVVVYEGKDKAVYYAQLPGPIAAGELEFAISMHDFAADYSGVELPQSVQGEVDQIVESLELVPAGE